MTPLRDTLLTMLDGATHCAAMLPWGAPGPIRLPDDRAALIDAHLAGAPAELIFAPLDKSPQTVGVEAVALIPYCPRTDGRCPWIAYDLDTDDHKDGGLADTVHAMRCLAERADAAGLSGGLLAARSRGGRGRHVFVFPPAPCSLADGALAVAALAVAAFDVAGQDAEEGVPHAFARTAGGVAEPGERGAFELLPQSTENLPRGWAIAMPAAGAYTHRGGGVIVDPFEDTPVELRAVPRCDPEHWARFVAEARARLPKRQNKPVLPPPVYTNDVLARARRYVAKVPAAVSGQRGHDRTFWLANKLIRYFGLSEADAFDVLTEWNTKCDPPWSASELEHKLFDALRTGAA